MHASLAAANLPLWPQTSAREGSYLYSKTVPKCVPRWPWTVPGLGSCSWRGSKAAGQAQCQWDVPMAAAALTLPWRIYEMMATLGQWRGWWLSMPLHHPGPRLPWGPSPASALLQLLPFVQCKSRRCHNSNSTNLALAPRALQVPGGHNVLPEEQRVHSLLDLFNENASPRRHVASCILNGRTPRRCRHGPR